MMFYPAGTRSKRKKQQKPSPLNVVGQHSEEDVVRLHEVPNAADRSNVGEGNSRIVVQGTLREPAEVEVVRQQLKIVMFGFILSNTFAKRICFLAASLFFRRREPRKTPTRSRIKISVTPLRKARFI
jgi:hypothetical protein